VSEINIFFLTGESYWGCQTNCISSLADHVNLDVNVTHTL